MTISAVRRARNKERKVNSKAFEEKLTAAMDLASDLDVESGTVPQAASVQLGTLPPKDYAMGKEEGAKTTEFLLSASNYYSEA